MAKSSAATKPKKTIGPFAAGIGIAIWLNTRETDDGSRQFRSITISPRRYFDAEAKEWKDASGFRPGDLPALIYALTKAQEYVFETPLESESAEAARVSKDDVPF